MDAFGAVKSLIKKFIANRPPQDRKACYDDAELLTFLEGRPGRNARKAIYAHLADCPACLDKLAGAEKLLYELKSEGHLAGEKREPEKVATTFPNFLNTAGRKLKSAVDFLRIPKPAYRWVALILLVSLVSTPFFYREQIDETQLPTRETQTLPAERQIQLTLPPDNMIAPKTPVEFRWNASPGFSYYVFLLLDAKGDIVWEKKTGQTRLTLPAQIHLQPEMQYFWQVEGFFKEGGSVISDMAGFTYSAPQ
ncbi:MAG: hypothetical protein KDD04_10695 [Sinomicrobium sp.]|nr:hypothetical protein [Sinomicrobium sp.]